MNLYSKKNLNTNSNNNQHHFPDLDNLEDLVTTLTFPNPISSRRTESLIANGVSLAGISIPALPAVSLDSLDLADLRGLFPLPLVMAPGMLRSRSLFLERFGISVLST